MIQYYLLSVSIIAPCVMVSLSSVPAPEGDFFIIF
nr:MAG TPA: hypothetical protein [Caudoviricetes sp.]